VVENDQITMYRLNGKISFLLARSLDGATMPYRSRSSTTACKPLHSSDAKLLTAVRYSRCAAVPHPARSAAIIRIFDPHPAALLADLNPELHRLPLGTPAASSVNDDWETGVLRIILLGGAIG
jgi:hypothetical protein